jgi:hypothetical protein
MTGASPRLALVGSGPHLVRAIEALAAVPDVSIVVVADVSGRAGAAAQLAAQLRVPCVTTAMDVFRTDANVVIETNGDSRQYERLLAVKPGSVEVLSALGLRLFLGVLARAGSPRERSAAGRAPGAEPAAAPLDQRVVIVVARERLDLYTALREALGGLPGLEVLLDRRTADRRARLRATATERRAMDRRLRPEIDAALRARGIAVVRLDARGAPA